MLDELRGLIVSYLGLLVQTPDMFPRHTKPNGSLISPLSFLPSLVPSSSPSFGLSSSSAGAGPSNAVLNAWAAVEPHETSALLADLAARFSEGDGDFEELNEILGPVFVEISRRVLEGEDSPAPSAGSSSIQPAAPAAVNQGSSSQQGPGRLTPQQLQQAAQTGNIQAVLAHLLGQAGQAGMPAMAGGGQQPPGDLDLDEDDPMAALLGGAAGGRKPKEGPNITGLEWRPYVTALLEAVEVPKMAEFLSQLPSFNPADAGAAQLERKSLLGPLLRLSSFPDAFPSLTEQFFSNPKSRNRGDMDMNANSLRTTLDVVQTNNFRLANAVVRSGGRARERMLAYWARAADLNAKRAGMRVRAKEVATDAFTVNLCELLLRFAEPFMDAGFSKIDRIDMQYFRHQKRFDASSLTRLCASEPEAKRWVESASASPPAAPANFITETFYLAARLCNLGPVKVIRGYGEAEKDMRRLKKRADEIEAERERWSRTPQAAQYDAFLTRTRGEVEKIKAGLIATSVQLLSPAFMGRLISFASFSMTWLVRLADPRHAHPKTQVELPLPDKVPDEFAMLPEHMFEDVCEIALFYSR